MSVSFNGFNKNTATFKTAEDITAGGAVKISADATVAACSDGENFCGFALDGEGGYACVQLCGAVTAGYSGTAPALGYSKLAAAVGGVKAAESGREYLVIAVDTAANTVTFLM